VVVPRLRRLPVLELPRLAHLDVGRADLVEPALSERRTRCSRSTQRFA
jgi:hypothetical protein